MWTAILLFTCGSPQIIANFACELERLNNCTPYRLQHRGRGLKRAAPASPSSRERVTQARALARYGDGLLGHFKRRRRVVVVVTPSRSVHDLVAVLGEGRLSLGRLPRGEPAVLGHLLHRDAPGREMCGACAYMHMHMHIHMCMHMCMHMHMFMESMARMLGS